MNYIVLDLEWNQCPEGKECENPLLPFEIIEIGALKTNSSREIIDSFHVVIKPVIYPSLHFRTKEVVCLTEEDLSLGIPFAKACERFFRWCGDEYQFATWGSMDLSELQRNMRFFQVESPLPFPLFYYDIQKLYGISQNKGKVCKALETAVDEIGIPKGEAFHRADADTRYTLEVMKSIDFDRLKRYFSIDYYQTPKNKQEEIHITYDTCYKYVSKEFSTKEEAMSDKTVTATRCYLCNKPIRKKIRWFSNNTKAYYSLMCCPVHGWVKGKIRIKKNDDGYFFVVKTIMVTDEEGASHIREIQEELRRRKRERRHSVKKQHTTG